MPQSNKNCDNSCSFGNTINKINFLLFGNPDKSDEISFVSKVNVMFKEISDIKKWLAGAVIFILTSCVYLGQQLHQIDTNANNIKSYIEHEQQVENRILTLENELKKINKN